MASREKHKKRSSRSYRNNMGQFAGFARKIAVKNSGVQRARSLREAFKNMFKRNKSDT